VRYLILSDPSQTEPASRIPGLAQVYTVISKEQALNGHAAEIAGNPCVIWPDRDTILRDWTFARELALLGEVKLLDVRLNFVPTPEEMLRDGWDYAQFLEWITGKAEHSTNIVKLVDANIDVINSDSPEAYSPAEADAVTHGSNPDAALPPLGAPDWPGESEPYWEGPQDHDTGDSRPLSPAEAYIPYTEPETRPEGSEWPEPANFWATHEPPEMRPEWLPHALADYAMHEAETMGVDPGIMGMDLNGFCCGAISDGIKIQVKADNPRWMQSARLWICIVGSSASKKSPALKEIDGPAWALERAMRERSISDVERYDDAMLVYEQQKKTWASEKANKGGNATPPEKPQRPMRNRLLVGDTTREALADVLLDQGDRGVMLLADEIVSIFGGMNQYKQAGNDRQFYLQAFDGGPFPVDRKGRDIMVPNLGVTILGGTQPSALRKIAHQLSLDADGLLQRFIPYCARNATEDIDRPSHHAGHAQYADILERLMELQYQGPVRFSAEAQAVRREFSQWAWESAKGEWCGDALRSHISKYDTFFARTCLLYHCIATAASHVAYVPADIPAEIAEQVSSLYRHCLFHHAVHFYGYTLSSSLDLIHHVREVASKILAFEWPQITPTLLAQKLWAWRGLKDWEKRGIFTALAEAGWTRTDDKRGYVPGVPIKYAVNPRLQDMFAEQAAIERAIQLDKSERVTTSNLRPRGKARTAGED